MSDYRQGFKDGFAAGLEEGKKIVEEQWRQDKIKEIEKSIPKPVTRLDDFVFGSKDKCPKCGITISGAMNYTCSSINCPTFYQATSSVGIPLTGAATYDLNNTWRGSVGPAGALGSMSANYESSAPGTNGPSGPIDYSMR